MNICFKLIIYYYWEDSNDLKYCRDCYFNSPNQLFVYYCYESKVDGKMAILKCNICRKELYNHNSEIYTNEEYSDSD